MRKKIKTKEEEFKIPRLIITLSLISLIIAYVICIATGFEITSVGPIIILMSVGVLLSTLGIVIKMQERKVDLDYDSVVVWKLCVVAGIILLTLGISCFFL